MKYKKEGYIMFKRKPKMIFEFSDEEKGGFTIKVKFKGKMVDKYIYGVKELIDNKIKANGKNKRK